MEGEIMASTNDKKNTAVASQYQWFQFRKELNYPIFVRFKNGDFDGPMTDFLTQQHFSKIQESETKEVEKAIVSDPRARVLTFQEANISVGRQITSMVESDRYGQESVVNQVGYRVYRFKNSALMIYSFTSKEWQIGVFKTFGTKPESYSSKIVLNRYLSFAFQSMGVIGFWGVPIDEGMVVQRYADSRGEAVYIDVKNEKIISHDGVKKLSARFKMLRLDPTLKNRNVRMTSEELLSFLTSHCTYFDTTGLTVPVRQMIQAVARVTEGVHHPEESFKPRTDLSL